MRTFRSCASGSFEIGPLQRGDEVESVLDWDFKLPGLDLMHKGKDKLSFGVASRGLFQLRIAGQAAWFGPVDGCLSKVALVH
jgi:hypothetical protein